MYDMSGLTWASREALAVLLIVILAATYQFIRRMVDDKRHPLPPGPKGLPIIGNVLEVSRTHPWKWAADKANEYGDLVFVNILGQPTLFVNSYQVAVDILENRSAIHSSRPHLVFASDLVGWDILPGFMPYGKWLRWHRAVMHQFLNPVTSRRYVSLQTREVRSMLSNILATPLNYDKHLKRFPGSVILSIMYGHEVKGEDDFYVVVGEAAVDAAAAAEAFHLVNYLPWLKYLPSWMPGTGFKEEATKTRKIVSASLHEPYEDTKRRLISGTGQPCAVSYLMDKNVEELVIAACTSQMFIAGQHTVSSTLTNTVLALVLNPAVQERAHEELDRVIGKNTLPTFEDCANLPYINAICMEALRWKVVLPLGLPHCSLSDDIYNGYFIPAGTVIFPNAWAMSKNEQDYPDPDRFEPERWLPGGSSSKAVHADKFIFGFGRRICQGRHVAQNGILIAVASILAAFNINKPLDSNGKPIEPMAHYPPTLIRHLERFDCLFSPRSPEITQLIRQFNEQTDGKGAELFDG